MIMMIKTDKTNMVLVIEYTKTMSEYNKAASREVHHGQRSSQ